MRHSICPVRNSSAYTRDYILGPTVQCIGLYCTSRDCLWISVTYARVAAAMIIGIWNSKCVSRTIIPLEGGAVSQTCVVSDKTTVDFYLYLEDEPRFIKNVIFGSNCAPEQGRDFSGELSSPIQLEAVKCRFVHCMNYGG